MSLVESEALEQVARSLERNGFVVYLAGDKEAARKQVRSLIPARAVVGIGDSATVRQIGILPDLEKRGTRLVNAFMKELISAGQDKFNIFEGAIRRSLSSDIFLTGTNTVTGDGKLVNIDSIGNRVAGMFFGPKRVILVIGRNKIVKNVDQAMRRIKDVVAPVHAATKRLKVPCAATGKCADCNAPARICNVTVILEKAPHLTHISAILVDEDLGLGWDSTWPMDRISKIRSAYEAVTWTSTTMPWHRI